MPKPGHKYLCTHSVIMKHSDTVAFSMARIYDGLDDCSLVNNQGHDHFITDDFLMTHFTDVTDDYMFEKGIYC